ncbi:MAG: potassium-transporting ATPase subunit KdpA [Bacilli bacterium]
MEWLMILCFLALSVLGAFGMSRYLEKSFVDEESKVNKLFAPIENIIFKISGIDPTKKQTWLKYVLSMLISNLLFMVLVFFILVFQHVLPMNPLHLPGLEWKLALNTVISFMTNTNLQHYTGEASLSYFSQTMGITFMMFVAPATTLGMCIAFIRALVGKEIGNFYQDFVRSIVRVFLPMAFISSIVFVSMGVPQTYDSSITVKTIEGAEQTIARGPVASLLSIKHFGNNGGGFMGVNSAHPFENPNLYANFFEMFLMLLLPFAVVLLFGRMAKNPKLGKVLFYGLFAIVLAMFALQTFSDLQPLKQYTDANVAGVSLEGKEVRLGILGSSLFSVVTTVSETGGVNSMHDTLTPLSGLIPMLNMMMNTIFGGVGAGFMNIIMYVIITVFIGGLMIGRTPEYLNKTVDAKEMKWIAVTLLIQPAIILGLSALALATEAGVAGISNPGFHGLTQVIYEFTSSVANNGSGFEGLGDNTTFWNLSTAFAMFVGRYIPLIAMFYVANSLNNKPKLSVSAGTLHTDTYTFSTIFIVISMVVGALTYLPVLLLGPIAEFLTL